MKTIVTINGTAIALTSIIRWAQPDAGQMGKFYPRQWVEPADYLSVRTSVQNRWQEEKLRKGGPHAILGDLVEIQSGGYLWLYHLDAEGNLRSDAFTWKGGIPCDALCLLDDLWEKKDRNP